MMNCYERIQRSIDYIEDHLTAPMRLEEVAQQACFSLSHYYRMFHALTGHTVKDYIRKRRLSEAAMRLFSSDDKIIDICFDYQFEYQESFTRAFKNAYGLSPATYRQTGLPETLLPRLNLIEEYFINPDMTIPDPKIKVLKKLSPMRVAYYRAISKTPERDAIDTLLAWADKKGLLIQSSPYRLFGFDNPPPGPENPVYGYEIWMTVSPKVKPSGKIKIKKFPGGHYAVTGTTVAGIQQAWRHFMAWLKISKYTEGTHQCLEEHLSPAGTPEESTQIDLYLPLSPKKS
jgi:AraC family transcriptional regulator